MELYSNCKINLGLRVVAKRPDGYHELETVMFPVWGLCDRIVLQKSVDNAVHFHPSGLIVDCPPEQNLCLKAYHVMKQDHSLAGVDLYLHKQVPMGAGLGGGSANAAYVIRGLNELFALRLTNEQMEYYAAQIGSDTAFFIRNQSALATGRGEQLTPYSIPQLRGYTLLIVKPDVHVSTTDAYRDITPQRPTTSLTDLLRLPINEWKDKIYNDFEHTIFPKQPQIKALYEELYTAGALYAAMSGSGASVYGIFAPNQPILSSMTQHFVYQEIMR